VKTLVRGFVIGLVVWLTTAGAARAQLNLPLPQIDGVGVDEKLGDTVPLDLEFVDDSGSRTYLGKYLDGTRPVILSLNYSRCPMLCNLQLGKLIETFQKLDWSIGREFDVVSVSIDPTETPEKARTAKTNYLKTYRRMESKDGVHFLVGTESNIRQLAQSVGFKYKYLPEVNEYSHAAVCMVCTPSGKLSRYLYGVEFPVETLRMALLEASEGKIGTTFEQFLLYCFHYNPNAGVYSVQARRVASLLGGVTVVAILAICVPYWIFDPHRRKTAAAKSLAATNTTTVDGTLASSTVAEATAVDFKN
jgi:protein SCO1/2